MKNRTELYYIISIIIGGIIFMFGISGNVLFIIGMIWITISVIGLATHIKQ